MTRTIWLASYPKSGNTWLRILIANLAIADGQPFNINVLSERSGIASARGPFDRLTLIDSGLLTHDEADTLRPRVYEQLASGASDDEGDKREASPPIRFVKVHDAYTLTARGEPLLAGAHGAKGAIVIVRDPRDVAPSLAHHSGSGIDAAIAFMTDRSSAFCGRPDRQQNQLRQNLVDWSGHVASWLDQRDIPVLRIRYEDMLADTAATLRRALDFAGWAASEQDIAHAAACARFPALQGQEQANGFREAPRGRRRGAFFRRGEAGAWRDELSTSQVAQIETAHAPMMLRLGYSLSMPAATRPRRMKERDMPRASSTRHVIRRFRQIGNRRRLLLAEAALLMALARLALIVIPFPKLAPYLGTVLPPTEARAVQSGWRRAPGAETSAGEIGWAVTRAVRYLPFRAVCLPQAMAARMMLKRRGIGSVLHFGAARGQQKPLDTHAWLDAAGVEVTGYPVSREFAEIACFV